MVPTRLTQVTGMLLVLGAAAFACGVLARGPGTHLDPPARRGTSGEKEYAHVPSTAPGSTPPGTESSGPTPVRHVKSREFKLRCKIANVGESGVEGIDVYVLRDNVWQKFSAEPGAYKIEGGRAVCAVKVQNPGRWGFTLIPRNGAGQSNPPLGPGDSPQVWVEVNETKPVVAIPNVVVGREPQGPGRLTVYWTASGVHLRPKPIALSYSESATGPWIPLVRHIDNTGTYTLDASRLSTPLPWRFFLKIEATDEAGNVGSAVTKDTVKIDPKVPQALGVDVELPAEVSEAPPDMPVPADGR
jgi:hypothetical protein